MDGGLLWNVLYCAVAEVATQWESPAPRPGHPDTFSVADVALVWLWAAFQDQPISTAVERLNTPRYRRAMRLLGYRLPPKVPHASTLSRRPKRPEFWMFLLAVNLWLIRHLHPRCRRVLIDSTPLLVPHVSHDPDATWGHHRQRGYRWHTLMSEDRVILCSVVEGANVHELTVAPRLIQQAAAEGWRPWCVVGDDGYDSEPLHREVHQHLRARLIAPLNDRGGRRTMRRTPLRAWLNRRWNTARIRNAHRRRPEIDRAYSVLKCRHFGLFALPPWIRSKARVERWIMLKQLLYHTYLFTQRRASRLPCPA
jgi:hypothetical protein